MSDATFRQEWERLYAAAMLEMNLDEAQAKIERANAAIEARLMELPKTQSEPGERAELHSALEYLRRLKASRTGS